MLADIDAGYGTITFLESRGSDGSVVTAIGQRYVDQDQPPECRR